MFRSAGNPVLLGLGTAAVLAAGVAVPVWAAEPSPTASTSAAPDVSDSPTPTPTPTLTPTPTPTPSPSGTPWGMKVAISVPGKPVFEGDKVVATIEVTAEKVTRQTRLRLTAGGRPVPALSRCSADPCALGQVGREGRQVKVTLTVPKEIKSGSVRLVATVSGEGAEDASGARVIEVRQKLDPTPSPTSSPSASSSPSPSPSPSGNGGSGGSGSGSGGTTTYTPPAPNGSFGSSSGPQVNLPQVSPPSPNVAAPGAQQIVPQSALRGNDDPVAQELTFERLASTQAAWLAALLVAFSLLLTQVRLGRRPASHAPARAKGVHRRPRRGMFGK